MGKRFDAVMFDLDGTLIDNRSAIAENFNYALGLHGYPLLPNHEIYQMIGIPLLEMFEKQLPESDKQLALQLVTTYRKRYHYTSHNGVVILDDVISTLENLKKAGFKLAVVTAKVNDETHPLLQRIGLYSYFDLITGFREGFRPKPHPDMVYYVMRELDVEPRRATLVGDTPVDVMTARNAGIYSIAVTSSVPLGFTTRDKIYSAKPDAVIDSLRDVTTHLYI